MTETLGLTDRRVAVVGVYPSRDGLQAGVQNLKNAGFRSSDISVLYSDHNGVAPPAKTNGDAAPEGAATGATTGVVMGGVLGWLAGVGTLAVPGLGLFVAAGPIVAALAGATAGGAMGGVAGGLVGLGMPEQTARGYQGRIKSGGTFISVHSDNPYWAKRAKEVLQETGAQDISTT